MCETEGVVYFKLLNENNVFQQTVLLKDNRKNISYNQVTISKKFNVMKHASNLKG